MKCPKCQTENEQTRRFCRECGTKFSIICPHCNFENNPEDKFCGGCGQDLNLPSKPTSKGLSFDEKIDKIQRYLPKGLTEKILSQRDRIEGERKQVTVMFCDMEGFTPLVEGLGPEEAYAIMDRVYEILIHKVHDYEGTVNEMTGDGIMALFGAPVALEDAPQRAIRSAMAIHLEMTKFSDKIKQEGTGMPAIKMRVGIHTGPVVVGTVGNNLRVEFKAVGDTVNLASRMEGLAAPGTSYVTGDTFKLTEGLFRFEALGEKEVKGKKELVKVYRVIASSSRRTRFDVSAERGLTPFIGRDRHLELLLDGFERAKGGRGQVSSIISGAGVGKSRLLYEFRKAVANEDATFLEGKCLSYSRSVAYHPVIDLLKSYLDIRDGDGDLEIKEKATKGLKILNINEASTLPYLLELLSVKESGIEKIPLSPEGRKDRILEALKKIVLKASEIRPLIIAIEDLHWIDKSSEDSFQGLVDSITGGSVFLIFTYRPEYVHTWGGKSYHHQVTLSRLSNRESLPMISHLLGSKDIDGALEDFILEKTEGVPFFIEEFIKSLENLKIIERKGDEYTLCDDIKNLNIPSTIQDIIMARVDALPESAKEILQIGSVIEREFGYEIIKSLASLPEQELLSHLSALKDSELVYERGIYPESTYIFQHALTREVVYDSILSKRKKSLHNKIGEAIENLSGENIEEQYGILAEHFIEGENYEKGFEYSKFAAKRAIKTASPNEAIAHAKRCIPCIERLPQTDAIKKRVIDARVVLAGYYLNLGQHVKAKDVVVPVAELAKELDYRKRLAGIYLPIGVYNIWIEDNFSKGCQYLNEAKKISEKESDFITLWLSIYNLACALSFNCEFGKGVALFSKCLDLSTFSNNVTGIVFTKASMSYFNYNFQGKIALAYNTTKEALKMAESSGDIFSKGAAYSSHGVSCYHKGFFEEGESSFLTALGLFDRVSILNWEIITFLFLGNTYFETGEYEKAEEYYKRTISLVENSQFSPSLLSLSKIKLAIVRALNGNQNFNMGGMTDDFQKIKAQIMESFAVTDIGESLLYIDDQHAGEAEDWIKKAIKMNGTNDMRWYLGRDYAHYAELYKRKGKQSGAKENLIKAIEILRECGADGWVEKYEKELALLL